MGNSFKGEKQGHLESAWAGLLGRTFQVLASCELPKQRALGQRDWKEGAPLALSGVSWVDSLQSATTIGTLTIPVKAGGTRFVFKGDQKVATRIQFITRAFVSKIHICKADQRWDVHSVDFKKMGGCLICTLAFVTSPNGSSFGRGALVIPRLDVSWPWQTTLAGKLERSCIILPIWSLLC